MKRSKKHLFRHLPKHAPSATSRKTLRRLHPRGQYPVIQIWDELPYFINNG